MVTGVIPAARPDLIEPGNRPYLVAQIVNRQLAGRYVTRPACVTIRRTGVDDADLTEWYATLTVEIVDPAGCSINWSCARGCVLHHYQ